MTSRLEGQAPLDLRTLMGCFATGVSVATTIDENGSPFGMTASAVSAVSLEPPLLLICVSHEASFHRALDARHGFALNILAQDQQRLSEHFADTQPDPFAGVQHSIGEDGVPLLDGVVAQVVCKQWGTYEAGDHTVFFGEVLRGEVFDRKPLLHYRSAYATIRLPADDAPAS